MCNVFLLFRLGLLLKWPLYPVSLEGKLIHVLNICTFIIICIFLFIMEFRAKLSPLDEDAVKRMSSMIDAGTAKRSR